MDNHGSSDNRILPKEAHLIILKTHVRVSKWIRNQISQITQMPLFLEWSTVSFTERIVMGSSSNASVSQVTEFVNMNTVFAVWVQALY